MIHDIFTPGNQSYDSSKYVHSAFDSDRTCFAPPKSDPGLELRRQSPESGRETAAEEGAFQSVQPQGIVDSGGGQLSMYGQGALGWRDALPKI